jgi:hypothetical protein
MRTRVELLAHAQDALMRANYVHRHAIIAGDFHLMISALKYIAFWRLQIARLVQEESGQGAA